MGGSGGNGAEQASVTGRRRGKTAAALLITEGGKPRSIRTSAPTQGRAGSRHNPRLIQPTLRVTEAQAACSPSTVPWSEQRPDGRSRLINDPGCSCCRRRNKSAKNSGSGRFWPRPNTASSQSAAPPGSGSSAKRCRPSHSPWRRCSAVRGLRIGRGHHKDTSTPARCNSRATTKPSPPL